MHVARWIIFALSLFQGVWLVFDGVRALTVGDYVTATSGPWAGQLGPWSKIVSAVGLNPRGTPVKLLHVFCGAGWLIAAVCVAANVSCARWVALTFGLCTLWYLPIGTAGSAVVLFLLWYFR